jgi:proteasome accessory factor C
LLNLVPYLLARPGIALAEAAGDLGISERQLREDLELLWVCGLPGYGPGDLIDMAFDGDRVTITYDAGIDRPLRLTQDEALALSVALRMLAETPGVANREAVERARQDRARPVTWWCAGGRSGCPDTAGARRCAAVEARRALRITYTPRPGRDHRTHHRPAADVDGRRSGVRGGVVPPGRGGPAVPGRPDRRVHRAGGGGGGSAAGSPARPDRGGPPSPDLPLITLGIGAATVITSTTV